ncbi:MAG: DNA (cytosine-5-)-methyltransferase [Pirellulaceae bacterium]|nr:DNA (cytosine-5-)-methyltransferase [Pirellulaceae bacterium]
MDRKRILKVTAGNLRQNHLYVRGHLDFFPSDAVGPARRSGPRGVEIMLDGLGQTIQTDIPRDAKTGRPRYFLRDRRSIGKFYTHHGITEGSFVTLQRIEERRYVLSVTKEKAVPKRPRAVEFFSGIGLVRLALERQGWDVVFANDIDPDKAEMYRHNWPKDDHLVVGDIHDLKASDIPDCELFTASFPCNDLSIAGRWEGLSGKESSAYWGLIDLLGQLGSRKPPMILLENVVGFLMRNSGSDFEKALVALNERGYNVDAFILNAVHWVPQSRARLFVVAQLDNGEPRQTIATECHVRPDALFKFINSTSHIRWNIRPLPPLPMANSKLADIIEKLPADDPHWWNEERAEYFMNQLSKRHAAQAKQRIEAPKVSYATAFRRVRNGRSMAELRTDGIAGCLRTPRGGSGRQILFKAGRGKYQVRLLTARECARLQGVPDDYRIEVPLNKALFGFGDAVCVPAIEWIAKNRMAEILGK